MPSGISEQVEELVLAIDTSGSVFYQISAFLSEVVGICSVVKPKRVRVLYWDTDVAQDEVYDLEDLDSLTASTQPKGGGGTDVRCVTDYMAEHKIAPQATIIFTDGYLFGGWGTWSCPTLWCVLDNKEASADVGKTLHIDSRKDL